MNTLFQKSFFSLFLSLFLVACSQADSSTESAIKTNRSAAPSNVVSSSAQAAQNTIQSNRSNLEQSRQSLQSFKAGQHYEVLNTPIPTADRTKVEVVEFFWYGCNHCFSFEPILKPWAANLADDVVFVPTPAMWAPVMELHARIYFASKVIGADSLHGDTFQAMNMQRQRLASESEILKFVASKGVDADKFKKAFNSFGVKSQITQSKSKAKAAGMKGTPEMLINGKYRVSAAMAGSSARMLSVANFLINKEREAL